MSWGGLMLDQDAATIAGDYPRTFALAYQRGFDRLASLSYEPVSGVTLASTSAELRGTPLAQHIGADAASYDFSVDYLSPTGRFAILRVTHH
jgi:hypothetical protein